MDRDLAIAVINRWNNGEPVTELNLYKAAYELDADADRVLEEGRYYTILDSYLSRGGEMLESEKAYLSKVAGANYFQLQKTASEWSLPEETLIVRTLANNYFVPDYEKLAEMGGADPSEQALLQNPQLRQDILENPELVNQLVEQGPNGETMYRPTPTAPAQVPDEGNGNYDQLRWNADHKQEIESAQAEQLRQQQMQQMQQNPQPGSKEEITAMYNQMTSEEKVQNAVPYAQPEKMPEIAARIDQVEAQAGAKITDPKQVQKIYDEMAKLDQKKVDEAIKQISQEAAQQMGQQGEQPLGPFPGRLTGASQQAGQQSQISNQPIQAQQAQPGMGKQAALPGVPSVLNTALRGGLAGGVLGGITGGISGGLSDDGTFLGGAAKGALGGALVGGATNALQGRMANNYFTKNPTHLDAINSLRNGTTATPELVTKYLTNNKNFQNYQRRAGMLGTATIGGSIGAGVAGSQIGNNEQVQPIVKQALEQKDSMGDKFKSYLAGSAATLPAGLGAVALANSGPQLSATQQQQYVQQAAKNLGMLPEQAHMASDLGVALNNKMIPAYVNPFAVPNSSDVGGLVDAVPKAPKSFLAHEVGHIKNYDSLAKGLKTTGENIIKGVKATRGIANLGRGVGAIHSAVEDDPSYTGAALSGITNAPVLLDEAGASFNALRHIKKQDGWKGVAKSAPGLGLALGSYVAGAAAPLAINKARKYFRAQKEKTASRLPPSAIAGTLAGIGGVAGAHAGFSAGDRYDSDISLENRLLRGAGGALAGAATGGALGYGGGKLLNKKIPSLNQPILQNMNEGPVKETFKGLHSAYMNPGIRMVGAGAITDKVIEGYKKLRDDYRIKQLAGDRMQKDVSDKEKAKELGFLMANRGYGDYNNRKLANALPTELLRSGVLHNLENINELAGLGVLAAPSISHLSGGHPSDDFTHKAEVAGLGMLAAPYAGKLINSASGGRIGNAAGNMWNRAMSSGIANKMLGVVPKIAAHKNANIAEKAVNHLAAGLVNAGSGALNGATGAALSLPFSAVVGGIRSDDTASDNISRSFKNSIGANALVSGLEGLATGRRSILGNHAGWGAQLLGSIVGKGKENLIGTGKRLYDENIKAAVDLNQLLAHDDSRVAELAKKQDAERCFTVDTINKEAGLGELRTAYKGKKILEKHSPKFVEKIKKITDEDYTAWKKKVNMYDYYKRLGVTSDVSDLIRSPGKTIAKHTLPTVAGVTATGVGGKMLYDNYKEAGLSGLKGIFGGAKPIMQAAQPMQQAIGKAAPKMPAASPIAAASSITPNTALRHVEDAYATQGGVRNALSQMAETRGLKGGYADMFPLDPTGALSTARMQQGDIINQYAGSLGGRQINTSSPNAMIAKAKAEHSIMNDPNIRQQFDQVEHRVNNLNRAPSNRTINLDQSQLANLLGR